MGREIGEDSQENSVFINRIIHTETLEKKMSKLLSVVAIAFVTTFSFNAMAEKHDGHGAHGSHATKGEKTKTHAEKDEAHAKDAKAHAEKDEAHAKTAKAHAEKDEAHAKKAKTDAAKDEKK